MFTIGKGTAVYGMGCLIGEKNAIEGRLHNKEKSGFPDACS